jgi:medium-chain acyl-[acyl-carrier-protein] hydrolase
LALNDAAWWPFDSPGASGRIPLICLPYAGGGASVYRPWRRLQPAAINVCPVQLPGREGRIREKPFRRVEPLVEALAGVLEPFAGRPFAIFGHSMGALIGFVLARRLRAMGLPGPAHLFVSAARPPGEMRRGVPMHTLSDESFVEALRELRGTPDLVLEHRELMELLLPTLRADFELCHAYEHAPEEALACPITAIGGLGDDQVTREELHRWEHETSGGFRPLLLPAGHFYLDEHAGAILSAVASSLTGGGHGAHRSG